MAKLTDSIRQYIVQRLACYDTPSQIADGVREEFGLEITRQQVHEYDPGHKEPAKKWRDLHAKTRALFLETAADIPIANRSVRLRRLERMSIAAEGRRNYQLAAQLLEQAAKEVGEAYTNTRNLKHSGRIESGISLDDLSDHDLAALASKLASELADGG